MSLNGAVVGGMILHMLIKECTQYSRLSRGAVNAKIKTGTIMQSVWWVRLLGIEASTAKMSSEGSRATTILCVSLLRNPPIIPA